MHQLVFEVTDLSLEALQLRAELFLPRLPGGLLTAAGVGGGRPLQLSPELTDLMVEAAVLLGEMGDLLLQDLQALGKLSLLARSSPRG